MSGLSLNDRATALGHIAEKIGGLHYFGDSQDKFCVYFLADFLASVAALTKIVQPFKEWAITLLEGNEVSPIFGLLYLNDSEPDVLPLIEAIFRFLDRSEGEQVHRNVERAFEQIVPDLVM